MSGNTIRSGLLDPMLLWTSLPEALAKLDPRTLWRNPVMFIVEIGALWSTVLAVRETVSGSGSGWFAWLIVAWLLGIPLKVLPQALK